MNEFLSQWSGYVLSERAPPMGREDLEVDLPGVASPLPGLLVAPVDRDYIPPPIDTPEHRIAPQAIEERLERA